jgi:hypothetical protein
MRRKTLWIGVAALIVALAAATAAFATQHQNATTPSYAAFTATSAPALTPSWAPGACRSLMSDPTALREMQVLRAQHQADMQAWFDKYGADPASAAARAALAKLRAEHWNDMRSLKKHGIDVRTRGRGSMMSSSGAGNGGMMGVGSAAGTGYGSGTGMMGGL